MPTAHPSITSPPTRPPRWTLWLAACATAAAAQFGPARAGAADASPLARDIEQQFRRGESTQALQRLDQALNLRPGDAALRFLQGVLLTDIGQTTLARDVFERMTQEFPDLPEPHNNLAVLQAASGRLDAARRSLETALQLDPAYRAAQQNLGDVYVRLAVRAYDSAVDGSRPEPVLQRKLQLARALANATAADPGPVR